MGVVLIRGYEYDECGVFTFVASLYLTTSDIVASSLHNSSMGTVSI